MEALWALGGMAVGAALTVVACRQWLVVGIAVRDAAQAHLDRAAGHLALVQEVEGRWGLSYPWFHVHEIRPGESLWDAVERERREKLAKTADLGANPGKTVLEDARGDVFGAGRRGEDGAKPASGGDPWFGWTGPPDPPVRLGAGTYPTGLAVDPTPWCPECRAFHPANQTGMLEQCAACMEAMPHLGTRCEECGAEWGEFCRPGCATRLKHTGVAVERKLQQDRERIATEADESAFTFHGKPVEWAHDPNSCGVCKAFVEGHDAMCGFQGGAECDCSKVYRTMEEAEAVHGPVMETFEPRCSYCGENHGLECPRALCIDCRAPRSHHSGRNCTADPPIFEDSVRRAYEKRYEAAPLCLVCGGYHDGEFSLAFSHTSKDGVPVYVRREPDPAFDSMPGDSPEMIAIKRSQAAFASGEREEIEAPMVPHDSLPLGPEVAGPGFAPTGCPACGRTAHFGQCPALGPGPCLTRASVPSGREGRQADADTER